jgi:hypothetical protein
VNDCKIPVHFPSGQGRNRVPCPKIVFMKLGKTQCASVPHRCIVTHGDCAGFPQGQLTWPESKLGRSWVSNFIQVPSTSVDPRLWHSIAVAQHLTHAHVRQSTPRGDNNTAEATSSKLRVANATPRRASPVLARREPNFTAQRLFAESLSESGKRVSTPRGRA